MTEKWRRVVSVPAKSDSDYFEVSCFGGFRHIKGDKVTYRKATFSREKNGTIREADVKLYGRHVSVNREVYLAFIGNIPKGYAVVHKDMDKQNNCVSNLKLVRFNDLGKIYAKRSSVKKDLKTIVRINTKGEYVAFYRGLHDAARHSPLSIGSIRKRCMGLIGDVWISDGTTFVYEEDAEKFISKMC